MSELDDLVKVKGVLMAGRFASDWSVAEHKDGPLFFPQTNDVIGPFCAAIQIMFNTMGLALGGFTPATWLPVHGWTVSAGDYSLSVQGDRFVLVEIARFSSFDELHRLLTDGENTAVPGSLRSTGRSTSQGHCESA
jgi:roadblock/LC7 domain-containing protein